MPAVFQVVYKAKGAKFPHFYFTSIKIRKGIFAVFKHLKFCKDLKVQSVRCVVGQIAAAGKICPHPNPVNVTLFRKMVIADIIKGSEMKSLWIIRGRGGGINPIASVLVREEMTWRQRQWCSHKARKARGHQKLGDARKDLPFGPSEGGFPPATLIYNFWVPELWENKFSLF